MIKARQGKAGQGGEKGQEKQAIKNAVISAAGASHGQKDDDEGGKERPV